jgi:phosphoadenosine phosphosulfate reductase
MPQRTTFDALEIGELTMALDDKAPQHVIAWALETFGEHVAVVTAFQAEGMVVLDMAYRLTPEVRVITVDTGRLPQATYAFMDRVRAHYPTIRLDVLFPESHEVEAMVRQHGLNLFTQAVPLRLLCCHLRKVRPLLRVLPTLDAWCTGLRRGQWVSRANITKVGVDHDHGGIVKVNPLADWTAEEVWAYIRAHGLPVHPLYAQGYTSIGCEPCTRPIAPGEDDRAGRWWWETTAPKECGLHGAMATGGFEPDVATMLGAVHHTPQGG